MYSDSELKCLIGFVRWQNSLKLLFLGKALGEMKIFGIGLNKTGTKTLTKCLYTLGFDRPISCRRDLLIDYRKGDFEKIFEVSDQNNSFADWPWCLMYKELYRRYGSSARYILTKRKTSIAWLESLKAHSERVHSTEHCRLLAYGHNYPHGFEEYHTDFYERHNNEVHDFFRRNQCENLLLELSFDAGDGWEKLCSFLDARMPAAPFPHEGSLAATQEPSEYREDNAKRILEQLKSIWQPSLEINHTHSNV